MRRLPAVLLLAALVLSGCGGGQDDASIRAVMASYTDAWAARDTAKLCSLLTPDTTAAAERAGKSCPEYLGAQLKAVSDRQLANARRVRINKVWVRDADDATVEFTGGNGVTRLKKVAGRWLIDGLTTTA